MGPGLTPQPYHDLPDWATNLMQIAVPALACERFAASGTVPGRTRCRRLTAEADQPTSVLLLPDDWAVRRG